MSTSISDLRASGGGGGNIPARTMGIPEGMFDNLGGSMMTPMSNSVGNIGNPMGSSNDNQFLNELFDDLGVSNSQQYQTNPTDISSQSINYAMEGAAHIPPDKNGAPLPTPIAVKNQYQAEMAAAAASSSSKDLFSDSNIMLSSGNYIMDLVHKYVKMPVIVFVIVFIVSLPQFNRFIFNFFPSLILESGQISIMGITLKSFIALIFAIIINYILTLI